MRTIAMVDKRRRRLHVFFIPASRWDLTMLLLFCGAVFFCFPSFFSLLLLHRRQELGHIRRGENDTVFYSAGSQGRKDSYIEKLFKQRAKAKKDEQPAAEADE